MGQFAGTTEVGFPDSGFPDSGFPNPGFPTEPPIHWNPFPPIMIVLIQSITPTVVVSGSTNTYTVHGLGLTVTTAAGFTGTFGTTMGTVLTTSGTSVTFQWTAPEVSTNTPATLELTVEGHVHTLVNAVTIVPIIEV